MAFFRATFAAGVLATNCLPRREAERFFLSVARFSLSLSESQAFLGR
ncbi:hypothetical protein ACN28S_37905 [Cystobacter fuscus]